MILWVSTKWKLKKNEVNECKTKSKQYTQNNLHNFTVPIKIIFETSDEPAIREHIIVRKKVYAWR